MSNQPWADVVTASEVAARLGISPKTLRAFFRKHKYPRDHIPNGTYQLTPEQADQAVRMWKAAH